MSMVSRKNTEAMESLVNLPTYTAGVAQSTAYRLLKKFTEAYLTEHDLTMMQWFIIGTIYEAGDMGIGVTELSKLLDTNVPYVTNTTNMLVSRGIILREVHGENKRSKYLRLSPDFIPTVQTIENSLRIHMRATLYSNITPEELLIYIRVLYKLNALLDHDDII